MNSLSATDARKNWADVFTRAVTQGSPVAIARGADQRALLIGFDEIRLLLDRYPFTTEVFYKGTRVTLWLSELEVYGQGDSFEDAHADLVAEVRAYVEEFLGDAALYLRAPNRQTHFPWILRAYVADAVGALADVLTAPPVAVDGAAA